MFRRNLQLPGNVELHQLFEEGIFLVSQQIVKPNTAADEDLLHTGNLPQLPQKCHIIGVVRPHILTGCGEQTLPPTASTLGQLLVAGRVAEIGGRATHVVDIALKVLILYHQLRFGKNRFVAPGLNDPPLMEGQGAEGASAKTAPVAYKAKLHFLDCRHTAQFSIAGMIGAAVG